MNCILIGKTPGTVIFMVGSGRKWFSKPNIFQIFFSKTETHADMIFLIMVLGRHFGMYLAPEKKF